MTPADNRQASQLAFWVATRGGVWASLCVKVPSEPQSSVARGETGEFGPTVIPTAEGYLGARNSRGEVEGVTPQVISPRSLGGLLHADSHFRSVSTEYRGGTGQRCTVFGGWKIT